MEIKVRVIPRARQIKITEETSGDFKIYTNVAPTDGKANEAVIKLLAKHFGIAKSDIELVRGGSSRDKVFLLKNKL